MKGFYAFEQYGPSPIFEEPGSMKKYLRLMFL